MAALNYTNTYALQDKVLAVIFSTETTFYRVSDNDFGKARGRNPSKAYR
jgi:hypothetical protein